MLPFSVTFQTLNVSFKLISRQLQNGSILMAFLFFFKSHFPLHGRQRRWAGQVNMTAKANLSQKDLRFLGSGTQTKQLKEATWKPRWNPGAIEGRMLPQRRPRVHLMTGSATAPHLALDSSRWTSPDCTPTIPAFSSAKPPTSWSSRLAAGPSAPSGILWKRSLSSAEHVGKRDGLRIARLHFPF